MLIEQNHSNLLHCGVTPGDFVYIGVNASTTMIVTAQTVERTHKSVNGATPTKLSNENNRSQEQFTSVYFS